MILLVEDKTEELLKAKLEIAKTGLKAVAARNYKDAVRLWKLFGDQIVGLLTDLHFPEKWGRTTEPPCGLALVAMAAEKNIPAVVCSDIDHHQADYAKVVVETLMYGRSRHSFRMDQKDWHIAVGELAHLLDWEKSAPEERSIKVLVVSENSSRRFTEMLSTTEVVSVNPAEAITAFLSENPTHVIVDSYPEISIDNDVVLAHRDILATSISSKIFRCGFERVQGDDFLRLPITADELRNKLQV